MDDVERSARRSAHARRGNQRVVCRRSSKVQHELVRSEPSSEAVCVHTGLELPGHLEIVFVLHGDDGSVTRVTRK